jgi:Tfp pilus assembly protein PilX
MERHDSLPRGIALVTVLVLLSLFAVLVVAIAGTVAGELLMAGQEGYRARASDAASTGIERELMRIASGGGAPASGVAVVVGPERAGLDEGDTYTIATRYVGEDALTPGSSVGRFVGYHYVIQSTGRSLGGALDSQTQGAVRIGAVEGVGSVVLPVSGALE